MESLRAIPYVCLYFPSLKGFTDITVLEKGQEMAFFIGGEKYKKAEEKKGENVYEKVRKKKIEGKTEKSKEKSEVYAIDEKTKTKLRDQE